MVKSVKDLYKWEIELDDETIITQGDDFDKSQVVRVSFIPQSNLLPRHDLIMCNDYQFIKRFCRGFLDSNTNLLKEFLHCAVTDKFRMYVKSSDGRVVITPSDYEMYL